MLGMYAEMSLHINNYTLVTENPNEAVELRTLWRLLSTEGERRQWPIGNPENEVKHYTFMLNYELNPVHTFEWIDYRGGSLELSDADEVRKEAHEFFLTSSCVFLCIDGKALVEPLGNRKRKVARELRVDVMMQDLIYLKRQRGIGPANPFPLVIIVTKYDLCRHRGGDVLMAELRELLDLLFVSNSGWLVAICPVSLGFGLVESPLAAPLEPENVHLPVAFAVYAALEIALTKMLGEITTLSGKLDKERDRFILSRVLFGDDSDMLEGEIKRTSEEMVRMEEDAVRLASEIAELEVYLSGQRVNVEASLQQLRLIIARSRSKA
jgi:hypothetical protein